MNLPELPEGFGWHESTPKGQYITLYTTLSENAQRWIAKEENLVYIQPADPSGVIVEFWRRIDKNNKTRGWTDQRTEPDWTLEDAVSVVHGMFLLGEIEYDPPT